MAEVKLNLVITLLHYNNNPRTVPLTNTQYMCKPHKSCSGRRVLMCGKSKRWGIFILCSSLLSLSYELTFLYNFWISLSYNDICVNCLFLVRWPLAIQQCVNMHLLTRNFTTNVICEPTGVITYTSVFIGMYVVV